MREREWVRSRLIAPNRLEDEITDSVVWKCVAKHFMNIPGERVCVCHEAAHIEKAKTKNLDGSKEWRRKNTINVYN